MVSRVQLEPAYVLHRRPYSNTSLVLDLFTLNHGRLSVLARSARGLKSRYKGRLELFSPMLVSWVGRGELKTLGDVELEGPAHQLVGESLLCGFYLNELLVRFLHREDAHTSLFLRYKKTLASLSTAPQVQAVLRYFEKHLLQEVGYGLPLQRDASTGLPLDSEAYYHYHSERGFSRVMGDHEEVDARFVFLGQSLLAFRDDQLADEASLKDIKRLMRLVFTQHLSGKPINSRLLFTA